MIATHEDLPRIVEMMRAFQRAENLPYAFDQQSAEATISGLIDADHGAVFATDKGFICGLIFPAPTNGEWLIAAELFWWAGDGKGAALAKAFRNWAIQTGANEVRFSCTETNARVQQHLAKTMTAIERVYTEIT